VRPQAASTTIFFCFFCGMYQGICMCPGSVFGDGSRAVAFLYVYWYGPATCGPWQLSCGLRLRRAPWQRRLSWSSACSCWALRHVCSSGLLCQHAGSPTGCVTIAHCGGCVGTLPSTCLCGGCCRCRCRCCCWCAAPSNSNVFSVSLCAMAIA
jgi:hypothetical protein